MKGGILDADTPPPPTFVERHFFHPPTIKQNIFDVALGMIIPVLCYYLDPGILGGGFLDDMIGLPNRQLTLFIYIFSGLAIPILAFWLLLGPRVKRWGGLIGGMLLAGAMLSFIIGVLILPLTLYALTVVIGVLGFIPFLTAFVYLRNGLRAIRSAKSLMPRFQIVGSFLLGAVLVVGIAVAAQSKMTQIVSESMEQILRNDDPSIDDAVNRVKDFRWVINTRPILRAYEEETDPVRKERLAKAYVVLEGEDAEIDLAILRD